MSERTSICEAFGCAESADRHYYLPWRRGRDEQTIRNYMTADHIDLCPLHGVEIKKHFPEVEAFKIDQCAVACPTRLRNKPLKGR